MLEAGARALARMGSVAVEVRAQASKASEAAAVKDQETLVKGGVVAVVEAGKCFFNCLDCSKS